VSIFQALILGIVQGLSEFLPISSSAHLLMVRWFAGWPDPGLAFDVALHWGTLAGLVVYFRRELFSYTKETITRAGNGTLLEPNLPLFIILGTLPAAAIGFLFEHKVETALRSPWILVGTLSILGVLLLIADKIMKEGCDISGASRLKAFFIGGAQGLAVVPGVSRSGISITAGLLLGLSRESAAQFSFLLSIPLIFGAGLTKIKYLRHGLHDPVLWTGVLSSAVSGYIAVHFILSYVKKKSYAPFAVYRILVAALLATWILSGHHV